MTITNQGHIVAAAAVTAAGVVGGAYYAYCVYKQTRKTKLPEEWRQVGTLQKIYVYPIKSCGSVALSEAECSILGLRSGWLRDRILMIVDDKNKFLTARANPELLLIHPTVRNSVLTLKHKDMEAVHIDLAEVAALQKPETAYVWNVPVPVFNCGGEVGEWLSRLLNRSTGTHRLVYYASQNSRKLREKSTNAFFKFTKNDTGAFPDEVPFNIINQASVDEMNSRIDGVEVNHLNFRPNFVLTGAQAYDEDNWKFIKIGENIFEVIKPCTRCVLTTIDPETGIRDANAEPVQTLKSYRQFEHPELRKAAGSSPRMGLQISLRSGPGGIVSLNDRIYVA